MDAGERQPIETIPAGARDVTVNLASPPGLDLVLTAEGTPLVHWREGAIAGATGGATHFQGAEIHWSGYSGDTETLTIEGEVPTALQLQVLAVTEGTGEIELSWTTEENEPPIAEDDAATTVVDDSVAIDVLANDRDPEDDDLRLSRLGEPAHGSVERIEGDRVRYSPAEDFSGTDQFTYSVADGHGGTATATVAVTVKAPQAHAGLDINLVDDPAFDGFRDPIKATLSSAWHQWAEHFQPETAGTTLDLQVRFQPEGPGGVLASARTPLIDTGQDTATEADLVRSQAAFKLISGTDVNSTLPDGVVTIQEPLSRLTFQDGPVTESQLHAETLFAHEFGHLLGFNDHEVPEITTPFELDAQDGLFEGELSSGSVSEALPVARNQRGELDTAHLQNGLMAPALAPGEMTPVGEAEIGVLADLGLPLDTTGFV